MAKSLPSVVYLSNVNRDGFQSYDEAVAGGAISPTDLLALDFSTDPPTATRSAGTAAYDQLAVALEKIYDDANTKDAIDAAYAAGELTRYVVPKRGDRLMVEAAAGYTPAAGDIVVDGGATTAGKFAAAGTIDATTVVNTLKGKVVDTLVGGAASKFIMEVL